jgi:hypothetical protein
VLDWINRIREPVSAITMAASAHPVGWAAILPPSRHDRSPFVDRDRPLGIVESERVPPMVCFRHKQSRCYLIVRKSV